MISEFLKKSLAYVMLVPAYDSPNSAAAAQQSCFDKKKKHTKRNKTNQNIHGFTRFISVFRKINGN